MHIMKKILSLLVATGSSSALAFTTQNTLTENFVNAAQNDGTLSTTFSLTDSGTSYDFINNNNAPYGSAGGNRLILDRTLLANDGTPGNVFGNSVFSITFENTNATNIIRLENLVFNYAAPAGIDTANANNNGTISSLFITDINPSTTYGYEPDGFNVNGVAQANTPEISLNQIILNPGESTTVNFDYNSDRGQSIAFFNSASTLYSVPEPSSVALLGLGGLALIARRRR